MLNTPLINVLLFSLFWALQIFVTKLGFLAGAQLFTFTLQTGIITFLITSLYVLPRKFSEIKKIPKSTIGLLIFASAVHGGLGGVLSNAGIQLTSAINAGFLFQFTTVSTTTFAWIFLKEQMNFAKILSIFAVLIGSFFLITKGQFIVPHIGDIFILLACISWSSANIIIRKTLKKTKISADIVTFLRPVGGLPIVFLFISLSQVYSQSFKQNIPVNLFDFHQIIYVFCNALFVLALTTFLNRTLKVASASYMTIMSSITPIIVAFFAMIFLKENLSFIQLMGICLILSSSIITHYLKVDTH